MTISHEEMFKAGMPSISRVSLCDYVGVSIASCRTLRPNGRKEAISGMCARVGQALKNNRIEEEDLNISGKHSKSHLAMVVNAAAGVRAQRHRLRIR